MAKDAKFATMVCPYQQRPRTRAAAATFDLSAKGLDAFKTDHWLQNPLNLAQLRLKEKAFDESAVLGTGAGRKVPSVSACELARAYACANASKHNSEFYVHVRAGFACHAPPKHHKHMHLINGLLTDL